MRLNMASPLRSIINLSKHTVWSQAKSFFIIFLVFSFSHQFCTDAIVWPSLVWHTYWLLCDYGMSAQTESPDGCLALEIEWCMLCLLELERSHALRHKPALHSFILGVVDRDQVFPRSHLVMGCALIFGRDLFILKCCFDCFNDWSLVADFSEEYHLSFCPFSIYMISL